MNKLKLINNEMKDKICIIICLLIIVAVFTRCNSNNLQVKQYGEYTIEANFIDSNRIDGVAKYYDRNRKLVSLVHYNLGVRNGLAVNYYSNMAIKDSMFFVNGLKNGFAYSFDSLENLVSKEYFFYGIKTGHQILYSSNKLDKYFFSTLDKNDIVYCEYDSIGKCKLVFFKVRPVATEIIIDGNKEGLGLLIYFPKPPKLSITYAIGLTNKKHETKNETILNSDRLLVDTALIYPENGWYYYISTRIQSVEDSINRIYIDEYKNELRN